MKKWLISYWPLILIIVFQAIMLGDISDRLQKLENDQIDVYLKFDKINLEMQENLNKELSKVHLTKQVNLDINSIGQDTYKLDLRVHLKRNSDYSKVKFIYKKIFESEWENVELKKDGESYIGQIELSFDEEYEYKVSTEGVISEIGESEKIDKYKFIPKPPKISYAASYYEHKNDLNKEQKVKEYDLTFFFYDNDKNIDKSINIESIDVVTKVDNVEKTYKCKPINDPDSDNYKYKAYIPGDEVYQKGLNNKIDFIKMKIKYENGFIDYNDITDEFKKTWTEE